MTAGMEVLGEEFTEVVVVGTVVVAELVGSEGGRGVCEDCIAVRGDGGVSGTEARRKHR